MKRILIFFLVSLLISCSNPTENGIYLTADDIPIVNSIAITSEEGIILGYWYNPGYNLTFKNLIIPKGIEQEKKKITVYSDFKIEGIDDPIDILPSGFGAGSPYPNPGNRSMSFEYRIPRKVEASIWISPATLGVNTEADIINFGNHVFLSEKGLIIRELISNKILNAGYYKYTWDTKDYNNNIVPSGFYRIYFLLDKYLVYRDVFIANDLSDLPESMKIMINY